MRDIMDQYDHQCLLVIDNADNIDLFRYTDEDGVCLGDLLPQRCPTIITTRDSRFAGEFASVENSVEVTTLERDESVQLLLKSLPSSLKDKNKTQSILAARKLVERLGDLPLAISQAAANIREHYMTLTITDYLNLYLEKSTRLEAIGQPVRPVRGLPQSVLVTWEISYSLIQRQNEVSTSLLHHLGFFHRTQVLPAMVRAIPEFQELTEHQFAQALSPLINFSLIGVTSQEVLEYYQMHPMVQLWVTTRLDAHQRMSIVSININVLMKIMPTIERKTRVMCNWIGLHGLQLMEHGEEVNLTTRDFVFLLTRLSLIMDLNGFCRLAKQINTKAMSVSTVACKIDDHLYTAVRINRLEILLNLGQVEQALEEAMILRSKHPPVNRTAADEHNEACINHSISRAANSYLAPPSLKDFFTRQIERHSDDVDSRTYIFWVQRYAHFLKQQGRWKDAKPYSDKAMAWVYEHKMQDDPDFQGLFNVHATILQYGGEKEHALKIFVRVLDQALKQFQPTDINVYVALSNVSGLMVDLRHYKELDEMMRQVVEFIGSEDVEGYAQKKLAEALNLWGVSLQRRGQIQQAINVHRLAVRAEVAYQDEHASDGMFFVVLHIYSNDPLAFCVPAASSLPSPRSSIPCMFKMETVAEIKTECEEFTKKLQRKCGHVQANFLL